MNLFPSPKNEKYSHLDFSDDVPYLEPLDGVSPPITNKKPKKERVVGNFTPQDMKDLVSKVMESGELEPHWSEFEKKWISFK